MMSKKGMILSSLIILGLGVLKVNPAEAASLKYLAFITPAQEIATGLASDVMTIQALDEDSNAYTVTGDVTISLSVKDANTGASISTGQFSKTQDPWSAVTQVTISSGSNSTSFYYKDSSTTLRQITITATFGTISTTQSHEMEDGIFVNRVYDRIDGVHYHYETYNISSSETWTTYGSPYIIEGNVTIASGQTLQINAGVQVKFASGKNITLTCSGILSAVGTSSNGITFTSNAGSPAAGDWRGIIFSGSGSSGSSLRYCTLSYGGSPSLTTTRGMIECNNTGDTAGPTISNCTIQYSDGYGIYTSGTSSPIITVNTFSNCDDAAICSEAGTTTTNFETITGNTIITKDGGWAIIKGGPDTGVGGYNISSNTISTPAGANYGYNAIYIRQANHTANTTFYSNVPYVFEDISVASGRTLTLQAGTILKAKSDTSGITITGTINAAGSSSSPIIFTAFNDDTYGGDTNDSTVSASAGDWGGITFSSTVTVTAFRNCIERYAAGIVIDGSSPTITDNTFENDVIGVECKNGAKPSLQRCIIKNNTTGIYSKTGSEPTVRDCYITLNDYGVTVDSSSKANIQNSCIWNNDSYGVYSDNTSDSTIATNNWWGNREDPNVGTWLSDATLTYLYTSDTININVAYSPAVDEVPNINNPPTADAGEYGFSYGGSSETIQADTDNYIILSGGGSHDPDWDYLTYTWSQLSGTAVTLSPNTSSQQVYFNAVSTGTYVFQLIVNDVTTTNSPGYNSAPDIITISVAEGQTSDKAPVYLADDSGNTFSTLTKGPGDTITVRVYAGTASGIPGLDVGHAGTGKDGKLVGMAGTINYTKPSIIEPTTVTVRTAFFDDNSSNVTSTTNLDGANGEIEFAVSTTSDTGPQSANDYVLEALFTISSAAINGDTIYMTIDDLHGNTGTLGSSQDMYAYAGSPQIEIGIDAVPPAFASAVAEAGDANSCDNSWSGDTVTITFDEAIGNTTALTTSNIGTVFSISSGNSWDASTISWDEASTGVTIVLNAASSLVVGDIITADGSTLTDTPAENPLSGTVTITGSFGNDCDSPTIISATAYDGVGDNRAGIQAGDYVIIKFSESIDTTTSIALSASSGQIGGVDIDTVLAPSSGTWKDGAGAFSASSLWYSTTSDSDTLKIIFTTATRAPTITAGITITADGATLADDQGNTVDNSVTLGGHFGTDAYVWPGDTDNDGDVDAADVLPIGIYWGQTGSARVGASTSWKVQTVYIWSTEAASYADANGNGTVNASDVLVIGLNWGKTHNPNAAPNRSPQFDPAYYAEHLEAFRAMYQAIKNSPHTEGNQAIKEFLAHIITQGVAAQIPARSSLSQNYPNPFNPETWLPFALSTDTRVNINIYNLSGQLIRTLDLGKLSAGTYVDKERAAYWDGRDNSGQEAASGIYLYQLVTKDVVSTRKMIVLK
ncbi:MAG: right-handed parallel beta-helix repeat-containing protein [bacterium]